MVMVDPDNMMSLAMELMTEVEKLKQKVKAFFYQVVLLNHDCPKCQGPLIMISEGSCRCDSCRYEFDPTIAFQSCSTCGGHLKINIRRYQCLGCGYDVTSRFLFDGLVFDGKYFQVKMTESRQRKQQQRERVRQMLAESRSETLALESGDLSSVPGLIDALNSLTQGMDEKVLVALKARFDLAKYQAHIKSHLNLEPMNLREIPPLIDNNRLDLIWKFVAVIFLLQHAAVKIEQQDNEIWVMSGEADSEG